MCSLACKIKKIKEKHSSILDSDSIIMMDLVEQIEKGLTLYNVKTSDYPEPDEYVEIFGENISAVEVAEICETISYEIVCGVSQRVPRKYINRK